MQTAQFAPVRSADPLLRASATELAAQIRKGEVTSRHVVEAHIAWIKKVNPALNAVVRTRFAEALREADEADQKLRRGGDLPIFHGVPCTIKESFQLTGMPNTGGLVARRDVIADSDATAVARWRAAGAIPLGVTNVSELCMWMESSNKVWGRTNNAYDPRRTCGGSSGGEGAIVGAGGSPFGLGADIGGSIRMPAFFNGVFGHKPTGGLVPGSGQFPNATGAAVRYVTTGPICRRAEDLMPLLRLVAGPDGQDPGCTGEYVLGDPKTVSLEGMDVLSIEGNGIFAPEEALVAAQRRAAKALEKRGARVRVGRIEDLRHSLDVWSSMLAAAEGPSFAELMGNGVALHAGAELLKWATRRSDHTLPAIALALIEKVPKLVPSRAERAIEIGKRLKETLLSEIGTGVMLYPSYTRRAPRHHTALVPPIQWAYTAVVNVMELPSTQCPLGLNHGLPLGCQVVSAHGNDHVTIAVAQELERAFGGWVPPPQFFGGL
ncbi:MAG: amidase [Polyangiales bacterium]